MAENHRDDDRTQTHIPLLKDTMVGHYRIVDNIGAGGMGEVYLAEDTELNRKVALKFLPSHLCRDEDCRARFKREAQAAAKLDHPNIVTVYEVGEYNGRPFIAMQHIEGQSLKECAAGKELTFGDILELGIQLCKGLQAAHDRGIIHRDIKPSNILIDSHGRVRIVDFGLASVVGKDQLTKTGSTLGTIGYMSPEQVHGQEADHRSDLFSLGVVLYELITKKNPFKRDSEAATLRAVIDDIPEPMARFKTGLPDGLQAIIDKALDKDIQTRYQHADGMLSDLMRVRRSVESSQVPVSGSLPAGRSSRVRWFAAAIIVVAVVLMITKPWLSRTASDERDKIMLAVLPFENLGNPEDEYFADGITEEITGKLAKLSHLGVTSRTSSIQYKDSDKNIRQIGQELGVDYVLEGTVRWVHREGESHVRVQPQLIRTADDIHIWANEYDFVLEDILDVQSSIAFSVAEALNLSLLAPEQELLTRTEQIDPETYQLYLKGKAYRGWDISKFEAAMENLKQAVERNPDFAPARAELARTMIWHFRNFGEENLEPVEQARKLAEEALSLDSNLAAGYIALSDYAQIVDQDRATALQYLETAISREPNNADALASLGGLMFMEGNFQASYHFYKRACQLDPATPRGTFATVLYWQRKWDELIDYTESVLSREADNYDFMFRHAEAIGEKYASLDSLLAYVPPAYDTLVFDMDLYGYASGIAYCARDYETLISMSKSRLPFDRTSGDSALTYMNLSWAHLRQEKDEPNIFIDSALVCFKRFLYGDTLSGLMTLITHTHMAAVYALKGESTLADSICTELLRKQPVNDQASLSTILNFCAITYTLIGKEDEAIDILEDLASRPSTVSLFNLKNWGVYDPLRDHPRFKALIKKFEKQYEI